MQAIPQAAIPRIPDDELILGGFLLSLVSFTAVPVAHWMGIAGEVDSIEVVTLLVQLLVALCIPAALILHGRWARYRALAAAALGSTLLLVAIGIIAESYMREKQFETFRVHVNHRLAEAQLQLVQFDQRMLVAGMASSVKHFELGLIEHRELLRAQLARLKSMQAKRTAYRDGIREELEALAQTYLPAARWREEGMAVVDRTLAELDATYALLDKATSALVAAAGQTLHWFEASRTARRATDAPFELPRDGSELVELISRALAAENAFDAAHRQMHLAEPPQLPQLARTEPARLDNLVSLR